jgi:GNAT superfamily N-acetyltransferase
VSANGHSPRGPAQALLEGVLRDGGSLAAEYPLVFGADAPGTLVTITEQGQVRSACGVLVRDLVARGERVRVGLIGSVATDPRHRGRGLAARLLDQAQRLLADQGCVLALLWADDPGFYARRGWREAGSEAVFVVEAGDLQRLPTAPGATVRALAPDDHGALHRLYSLHVSRVDRTPAETRALLSCPGVDTLVLERGRDIAAYACLGRGKDLEGCVHEWGGAADDVLALVREHGERAARRGDDRPRYLMTPATARALHARLQTLGVAGVQGVLGMARLLDPAGAAELVRRAARGRVSAGVAGERAGAPTPHLAHFEGPGGELAFEPEGLLDLLLPPRGERTAIEALEHTAGLGLRGLPLPLYVWGLDSI